MMNPKYLYAKILVTGGVTLGLELVASRVLTPFFGVSLYVWSSILSITLIALACGYRGGGVLAERWSKDQVLLAFAGAGTIAALWLDICLWTYPFLFSPLSDFNLVFGSILACVYLLFIPLFLLSALNPLLVALLTDDRGDHGAGNVFFISTIGSVMGVFVVAYGLLPYLTNYQTINVLTLFSAALSLFLLLKIRNFQDSHYKRLLKYSFLATIVTGLTLGCGGLEQYTKVMKYHGLIWRVVAAEPSSFGHLQVVDAINSKGELFRRSLLNDGMVQNMFYNGGESAGLYTYALERLALGSVPDPKKALVLGIGAGVVPMTFAQDGMDVQAIDINHKMVGLAKKYFDFKPDDLGIKVNIEDARIAARHCRKDNDVVAIDLFRDDGIPEHLVTQEFFSDVKNCMNDQGVIVMNTFMSIKNPLPEYALLQTIAHVFGEVYFVQKCPDPGTDFTVAYVVARKGGPVGQPEISVNNMPPDQAKEFTAALGGALTFKADDPRFKNAPVLTDLSNQWKRLAYSNELAYRRTVVYAMPWQILMN